MTFVIHYINKEYYSNLIKINNKLYFYTNQTEIGNDTTQSKLSKVIYNSPHEVVPL